MLHNPSGESQGRARTIVLFIVSQHIMVHFLSLSCVCVNGGNPHPTWLWRPQQWTCEPCSPIRLNPNVLQKIRKTDSAFWHCCGLVKRRIIAEHLPLSVFFIIRTGSVYTGGQVVGSSTSSLCFALIWSLFLSVSLSDYVRECIVGTGQSYRGRRSVTVSGILCQAWASPIPHEHK